MAARSLTATPEGIEHINRALTAKKWSIDDLSKAGDCSRQPAVKFCAGQAVSRKLFVGFCEALELDWAVIAGVDTPAAPATPLADDTGNPLLQRLTQQVAKFHAQNLALTPTVRQQVYDDINCRCGSMRVLDMEQKIGIDDIYTSVNILEKLSSRLRRSITELQQDFDLENFDRFVLGQVRQRRVPGLKAVERYAALMVLGKPGSGKTTFMKRLATLCNGGKFWPQRVPVFVTLKEFAEAEGRPGLEAFIAQQWRTCGVADGDVLPAVLRAGGALILLDGLDEVQEAESNRTLRAIQAFTNQYRNCRFVMTCRIAAREYTFQQFTEVEVADFDAEQIADFAGKWFRAKEDPEKGETFIQRLEKNEPIQELATNPLLLTLLCLVFGEAGDFPANRAELYKEGLDVLLKKWDAKRNIERDQIYKKLSLKRKEDLLSQLAFTTFERGDYFFKQNVVEQHIVDYIRNLPGASEDEEALQVDSEAVLKSIEAQHGLLVERARGIYSFSHLTFQEYFTARQITRPSKQLDKALADLVQQLTEKRYREIFLLAVRMLPEADELLVLMKQQADLLLADDLKLQQVLQWVKEKSQSVSVSYKPAAVRAFYLDLDLDLGLARSLDLDLVRSLARSLDLDRSLALDRFLDRFLDLDRSLDRSLDLARSLALDLDLARDHSLDHSLDHSRSLARDLDHYLDHYLDRAAQRTVESDPELKLKIDELKAQLPRYKAKIIFKQWWKTHGPTWPDQLRTVMIEHRNIGHDWQFTETQKEKLQQYYNANKLLVDCLNSDCYVDRAIRQRIKDTLLLPVIPPQSQP